MENSFGRCQAGACFHAQFSPRRASAIWFLEATASEHSVRWETTYMTFMDNENPGGTSMPPEPGDNRPAKVPKILKSRATKSAGKQPGTSEVPGVDSGKETAALLQRFDKAARRRKAAPTAESKAVTDDGIKELRRRLEEMTNTIDTRTYTQHAWWICQSVSYVAVVEEFGDFCSEFLGRDMAEVINLFDDAAGRDEISMAPFLRGKSVVQSSEVAPEVQVRDAVTSAAAPIEILSETNHLFWASRINEHLTQGVQSFIEAGQDLIAATDKLDHGQIQFLFQPGVLRVSQRTAQMLMRIARHPVLSKANNYSLLPPTLNVLYKLSKLDESYLQQAIEVK
jgi:hypothetical protein